MTVVQNTDHPEQPESAAALCEIAALDGELLRAFQSRFVVDPALNRQLVSFQANKSRPAYRWYRYKEAYSAALVEYLLARYGVNSGVLLDPFAGSGTTLFAASMRGLDADGIELLSIGQQIIGTRDLLEQKCASEVIISLTTWIETEPWLRAKASVALPELRITKGAYPAATQDNIERYMSAMQRESDCVQTILRFALLCVLEEISFTRKDGQYLRWDFRSGRRQGTKRFDKGHIFGENCEPWSATLLCTSREQPKSDYHAGC